jgi:ssDNA-binding Zn-finger/Zn-ribbon topoisomerase 1
MVNTESKPNWLEKHIEKHKDEYKDKVCPVCGKPLTHESIGYMRYGYVCNNISCHYNPNRDC